jgi:hypothetical protein
MTCRQVTFTAHDHGDAATLPLFARRPVSTANNMVSASSRLSNEVLSEIAKHIPSADKQRLRAVSSIFLQAAIQDRYERITILPIRASLASLSQASLCRDELSYFRYVPSLWLLSSNLGSPLAQGAIRSVPRSDAPYLHNIFIPALLRLY